MLKTGLLLLLNLALLWWFVRKDGAEYAAFKKLTATADRQRTYRQWVMKSFLVFSGASLLSLLILRRLDSLMWIPGEFVSLATRVRSLMPAMHAPDLEFVLGFVAAAMLAGILFGVLLARRLKAKPATPEHPGTLASIEPLMPRNAAETAWTALLSINAGLSEELFFRLLLPLLLASLLQNALLGFVVATLLFGLVHVYQGVAGILMTAILGGILACLYLWTGSLWVVIAVHAGIDLLGLVVRPTLTRLLHRSHA